MNISSLTPTQLRSPAIMLETLQMAYRYLLDEVTVEGLPRRPSGDKSRRLDTAAQHELGRRLGMYWSMRRGDSSDNP